MQVIFPRALGVLALLWAFRALVWHGGGWSSVEAFLIATSMFALGGAWLLRGRRVPIGAGLVAAGCGLQLASTPARGSEPVILLLWVAAIIFVTDEHPGERALLLRVCVSCVYGFTALAKINPAFLAGDQMVNIAMTRPHMGWTLALVSGPAGVALAWGTVAVELWLAVGLWFERTRLLTAATGVAMHLLLVPVAAFSFDGSVPFLLVLNGGLLAMYPAFWYDLRGSKHQLQGAV